MAAPVEADERLCWGRMSGEFGDTSFAYAGSEKVVEIII
jgi:hypothetical protein